MSLPLRTAAPASSILLHGPDNTFGRCGIAEGNEHLVQHNIVQDVEPCRAKTSGKQLGELACAAHEVSYTRSAQEPQRGPGLNATRPPRRIGRVVHGLP